jgi:hypothetical protein
LRLLGHGPRGRAYLARPLNLEPLDVLKQLAADRTADPLFVAHHVREAFAAVHIQHPNLTGIRLLGMSRGHHYSVVPYVAGPSLAELVHDETPLEPYQATVLVLQAARALLPAHAEGLWHRDVKPENLRLDSDGLVKLDDLGLEMTPSLAAAFEARERPNRPLRGQGQPAPPPVAMVGTPAFMAPEQSRDPLGIDGRADIYALGATYYNLVAGKPPFAGENAVELIRKHREELPVPPEELARGLPRPISDAIRTMMGKHPEERYPTMGIVVDVLELILDLNGARAAELLAGAEPTIRAAAEVIGGSSVRRVRIRILALCSVIGLAFTLLLLAFGLPYPALGILGFGGLTATAIAISSGITHRSELLRLVASVVLGPGVRSWLVLAAMALAGLFVLVRGGFFPLFVLVCAGGLAIAYHLFLDRPWASSRRQVLESASESVQRLRARGFSEQTVRGLVLRCGGEDSAELLEGLFGRRALVAEETRGAVPRSRRGLLATGRELLASLLENRLQGRLDRLHASLLERSEEARLEAGGLNLLTARRRARRISKAMMLTALEWRDERWLISTAEDRPVSSPPGPPLTERLSRAASQPEPVLEPHEPQRGPLLRRVDSLADILLGRTLRFLLGALLMVLFAVWLDGRGILTANQVQAQASEAFELIRRAASSSDPAVLRELRWDLSLDWRQLREPVEVPGFPDFVGNQLPGANLGLAALVVLISIISRSRLVGFLALLGSVVALFGPRWGLAAPALLPRFDAPTQARFASLVLLIAGFLTRSIRFRSRRS